MDHLVFMLVCSLLFSSVSLLSLLRAFPSLSLLISLRSLGFSCYFFLPFVTSLVYSLSQGTTLNLTAYFSVRRTVKTWINVAVSRSNAKPWGTVIRIEKKEKKNPSKRGRSECIIEGNVEGYEEYVLEISLFSPICLQRPRYVRSDHQMQRRFAYRQARV